MIRAFAQDLGLALRAPEAPAAPPAAEAHDAAAPGPLTFKARVIQALRTDNRHRFKGVAGDLIPLSEVAVTNTFPVWDGSVPVLVPVAAPVTEPITTLEAFAATLAEEHPWVAALMALRPQLVVAGGMVQAILKGNPQAAHDIDLFLVGISEAEADAAIGAVVRTLAAEWLDAVEVFRTETCVTIRRRGRDAPLTPHVQVILRLYDTISEVLHGFDLGSCAVAYTGDQVWFTSLSKLAFECGVNVVDMSRRRASYEHRLLKYFDRGFAVVMPNLDLDAATREAPGGWVGLGRIRWMQEDVRLWGRARPGPAGAIGVRFAELVPVRREAAPPPYSSSSSSSSASPAPRPEADENEVPYDGGISYNSPHLIARNNFIAVTSTPMRTKRLCGWASSTASELEALAGAGAGPQAITRWIRTIQPRFEGLSHAIQAVASPNVSKPALLRQLVGAAAAKVILGELAEGRAIDYECLASGLVAAATGSARAHIPFTYMTVLADTALIGPFATATLSLSEWYGPEFFKPAEGF